MKVGDRCGWRERRDGGCRKRIESESENWRKVVVVVGWWIGFDEDHDEWRYYVVDLNVTWLGDEMTGT